jgi:hypothetical protein
MFSDFETHDTQREMVKWGFRLAGKLTDMGLDRQYTYGRTDTDRFIV